MRDEAYRRDQIPAYGAAAQPALAERMRPLLRMSQVGNAAAVLAVLLALVALLVYSDFYGDVGRGWTVASFVCSVLLLGVCTFQHVSWQRAMAVWRGQRPDDLERIARASFLAQFASYALIAIALVTTIVSVLTASWAATSSVLLIISLVIMIGAQVLAGVQYVRVSGPPGALPSHMHKAIESQQRRA
jgi:hypothetical protein